MALSFLSIKSLILNQQFTEQVFFKDIELCELLVNGLLFQRNAK